MARRSRRDGGRLGDARAAPQKSKGQALWELGNAVILVLREETQSRRAKEARAASRRARSAGPVTIHAHVTGPSHTSVRVGNGLYTLYTHICPQGTTACAGPSRPRAPPPARWLGGEALAGWTPARASVTPLARCRVHLGPASWGDAPRVPRVRYY